MPTKSGTCYTELFGWSTELYGPGESEYAMISVARRLRLGRRTSRGDVTFVGRSQPVLVSHRPLSFGTALMPSRRF